VEDHATPHTAKLTQQLHNRNGVDRMCWPANSPDLNPIENVWRLLKQRVDKSFPRTVAELRQYVEEEWAALDLSDSTEAEMNNVAEVQSTHDVIKDFLVVIIKVAPTWATSFQEYRHQDTDINRKQMMKRFREYMALTHPIKGKQHKGAFAAAEPSLAAGGASTQGTDRDASHAAEDAPSIHEQQTWTTNNQRGRGRPRQKRSFGQSATSKQSSTDDTAAVGGLKCPACEQRHSLKDCFYAFPEYTPEWFNPRPGFTAMVNYRIQNDSYLQEEMRKVKRLRSQNPRIKQSHTQTPSSNNE